MAMQSVTPAPANDMPTNEIEWLLATALGDGWMKSRMGKLSPEELKGTLSLSVDTAEQTILRIRALGRGLGSTDNARMEPEDVRHIGWTLTHLADYADLCMSLATMAEELSTPEGREWLLEGKLPAARGGAA